MNEVTKTNFFPHSVFGGVDPKYMEDKKKEVSERYSDIISQTGNVKKADKYLEKVADNAQTDATGSELVQAVKTEVGLTITERIVQRTGMSPGEFIADGLLDVLAEPQVTVSHSAKSGLSIELKSQPAVKVKALEQLGKIAKVNEEDNAIPIGVCAMPLDALLKMQMDPISQVQSLIER